MTESYGAPQAPITSRTLGVTMIDRKFYLGPGQPMTWLRSWDEIVSAADGGLLNEHQWIELKERPAPSGRTTNLELGRDLASLSVDGGLLIFGIADKTFEVVGCPVGGLLTRISQVASATVHPPLSPVIHGPFLSPTDPDSAVVVVEVPASADAPHMVDDRYWGRSPEGKRPLSDSEVRRLLDRRRDAEDDFAASLDAVVASDPLAPQVEGHPTGQGHLYLLARPIGGHIDIPDGFDPRRVVASLPSVFSERRWTEHLGTATYTAHDPDGIAYTNFGSSWSERTPASHERRLSYFSIKDDGSVLVVDGGATALWKNELGRESHCVLPGRVALIALQAMELIRALALEQWGFTGEWRLGVHVSELQGKAASARGDFGRREVAFVNPTYRRDVLTAPATWKDTGETVAHQLLAGFFKGLGLRGWDYQRVLSDG